MAVGRTRSKGGAGGAKGPSGPAGAGKASGAFGAKVGKSEGAQGPSGLVGSGNVGNVDPIAAHALDIARQLKSGQIKTKEEATKKLVADILREKVRMQSKALTQKIAESLEGDPRIAQALERLWAHSES